VILPTTGCLRPEACNWLAVTNDLSLNTTGIGSSYSSAYGLSLYGSVVPSDPLTINGHKAIGDYSSIAAYN